MARASRLHDGMFKHQMSPSRIASRLKSIKVNFLSTVAFSVMVVCIGHPSYAAENNWIHSSGSSSWFAPGNWSDGVPTADDDVFVNKDGTTAFIEGPTTALAANLSIDDGGVTIGNINSGSLTVDGELSIGTAGSDGRLNLNFGTLSVNTLTVGLSGTYSDTSFGTLNLTGTDPTIQMAIGVNVVVNSTVTGSSGLNKAGLGTLTLVNNNTYTGGTTISLGTLQVGNGGTTGSLGEGDVVNNGTLIFNRSDEITVDNLISGTGHLRQSGSGTLVLTADNTYTGGTTISSGTLQVGDGGTSGSLGTGNVTNNALLVFDRSDDITVGNQISGSGSFRKEGEGRLTLTGNNTYSGSTTINEGTLQVGDGGTTGTLGNGVVSNNAALVFNRSDTLTVSNGITGAGTLTHIGTGTTILMANNNYSGITTISNGTLQVGNGGGTGSLGTNEVHNFGSLVFNRSNAIVINNIISGTGSLTQAGTNTLTLAGTNTYSGGTAIENGGTIIARNGSALGSGDLNINNGTFRAESSHTNRLQINVGGNFTQSGQGTLEVAIGGTGSNKFDQILVDGTATIDGTLRTVGVNGYRPRMNDEFALLIAEGGLTGTYSGFSNMISHSELLSPELVYNSNNVTLRWEQLSFREWFEDRDLSLTRNQTTIANALDAIADSTASNDVALIDFLDYLPDLTNDLPVAFDRVAPEELTAMLVASFAVMDLQGQQFLKRANDLRADYRRMYHGVLGYRARSTNVFSEFVDTKWNSYVEVPINFVGVGGDDNAAGYDISSFGLLAGGDRRLNEHLTVGAAIGYSSSSADLSDGGSLGMDTFNAQVYGVWMNKGAHMEGMLGGVFNSYDTERATIGGTADGSADGYGWTMLLGGGYDWESGPWKFGPQANIQYKMASISEFTESGSLAPLQIESQSEDSLHAQLGVNVRYRHYIHDTWTFIVPEVFFGWRHDFTGTETSLESQFASGAGETFTVDGPELGSDSIVFSIGVTAQWKPALSTYLHFTTNMGRDGYDTQTINLGARYSF
jgi:outer membrane autotransporter protein